MNVNYFNVGLQHKSYSFIRTESRFLDVSESRILADGLVIDAIPVPTSTVADLIPQAEKQQQKARGKASRIRQRRLRKEVLDAYGTT